MKSPGSPTEAEAVATRYARRAGLGDRYSLLRPEVMHAVHERQRGLRELLVQAAQADPRWSDLPSLRLTEVGCGHGGNLLELLRLGLSPANLTGLELLPERVAAARALLPAALVVVSGDARLAPIEVASQDLVLASTVFSSLLDDAFQADLAAVMWSWLKPGGAVLWYDFTVDNPRNPDVRGMPRARVQALFPQARASWRRVTLAPPIARAVTRLHPALYPVFNALPPLRTHLLGWLAKEAM